MIDLNLHNSVSGMLPEHEFIPRHRPELRLVITSATLDGEKFSAYFGDAPVMSIPGRCFPVDVVHSEEDHTKDYLQARLSSKGFPAWFPHALQAFVIWALVI